MADLFSLAEARAYDQAALANTTTYPDALLIEARDRIEEDFSQILGVAVVPTTTVVTLDGNGLNELILPHPRVSAVTKVETRDYQGSTWTEISAGDLADLNLSNYGRVYWEGARWTLGRSNLRVTYTHGYNPAPLAVKDAALTLLVKQLVPSDVDWRTLGYGSESVTGSYRYVTPGFGRYTWYGLPPVDAVLQRYREQTVRVA